MARKVFQEIWNASFLRVSHSKLEHKRLPPKLEECFRSQEFFVPVSRSGVMNKVTSPRAIVYGLPIRSCPGTDMASGDRTTRTCLRLTVYSLIERCTCSSGRNLQRGVLLSVYCAHSALNADVERKNFIANSCSLTVCFANCTTAWPACKIPPCSSQKI